MRLFKPALLVTMRALSSFREDHCSRLASSIAYSALFSIIPLVVFCVSIIGVVLRDDDAHDRVVDEILEQLPLSEGDGRSSLERALDGVSDASAAGLGFGLLGTVWAASAMFGAIRGSLNTIWRVEQPRPFVQAKLFDLLQVGGLTLILLASLASTAALRTVQALSADALGPLADSRAVWTAPAYALPALISFGAFLALYRFIPAAPVPLRDAAWGALPATILFELLKNTFALYVEHFNNYDVVYGSLAGVLLFLFYVWLASNIILLGAATARAAGEYGRGELPSTVSPGLDVPIVRRALRMLRRAFVRG